MGFRRLESYWAFRRRLTVPLIAVEMADEGSSQLGDSDADILIRVHDADIMFQKERLLNVALAALPKECEAVAWLDCDLVFDNQRWPELTMAALGRYGLVQTFEEFYEMPPTSTDEELDGATPTAIRLAWASELGKNTLAKDVLATNFRLKGLVSGGAVACRRDVLDEVGFYDACIIGGGVRPVTAAAVGRLEDAVAFVHCGPAWREHLEEWAARFYDRLQGRVGSVPGVVRHLWHGDLTNRRYGSRHEEFARFEFDPGRDLRMGRTGGFQWDSEKPEMHAFVREYFRSRREDG